MIHNLTHDEYAHLSPSILVHLKLKGWQYEGWAPNRPIQPGQKGYDPKKPNKKKHPETEYFTYYSLTIKGKTYWANVKMHKPFKGEVLYTIEENKPKDLIEGLPKTGKDQ